MTPHVLDRLPFWVGGDLAEAEGAAVEAHLSQCAACRHAANDFRLIQGWLRDEQTPPFEERDRNRLRQQVLAQVRAEAVKPRTRAAWAGGGLLAAAALLVACLVWRLERPTTVPSAAPRESGPASPMTLPGPDQPRPSAPAALPAAPRMARLQPRTESPPGSGPISTGPTRIEFQTADPKVRIIWLAQAQSLPKPTEAPPEEP